MFGMVFYSTLTRFVFAFFFFLLISSIVNTFLVVVAVHANVCSINHAQSINSDCVSVYAAIVYIFVNFLNPFVECI